MTARVCEACHGEKVLLTETLSRVNEIACPNCDGTGVVNPPEETRVAACCGRRHPVSKLFVHAGYALCNHPRDCGNSNRRNRG